MSSLPTDSNEKEYQDGMPTSSDGSPNLDDLKSKVKEGTEYINNTGGFNYSNTSHTGVKDNSFVGSISSSNSKKTSNSGLKFAFFSLLGIQFLPIIIPILIIVLTIIAGIVFFIMFLSASSFLMSMPTPDMGTVNSTEQANEMYNGQSMMEGYGDEFQKIVDDKVSQNNNGTVNGNSKIEYNSRNGVTTLKFENNGIEWSLNKVERLGSILASDRYVGTMDPESKSSKNGQFIALYFDVQNNSGKEMGTYIFPVIFDKQNTKTYIYDISSFDYISSDIRKSLLNTPKDGEKATIAIVYDIPTDNKELLIRFYVGTRNFDVPLSY